MLWETLWALVLGFTLSGAVQAFVSREKMQARLGDHGPLAVVRASWYGMVSSSCSNGASAMTKLLFAAPPVAIALRSRHDTAPSPAMNGDYIDQICGEHVNPESATAHRTDGDDDVYFCAIGCADRFDEPRQAH